MSKRRPRTIGSIERLDPAIDALVPADAKMEVIGDGLQWSEGPVWIQGRRVSVLLGHSHEHDLSLGRRRRPRQFLNPSGYTGETPRRGEMGSNGLTLDQRGSAAAVPARRSPRRPAGFEMG